MEWVSDPSQKYGLIKAAKDFKLGMGEKTIDSLYEACGDRPDAQELMSNLTVLHPKKIPQRALAFQKLIGLAMYHKDTDSASQWLTKLESEFGLMSKLKAIDVKEHSSGKHKDKSREDSMKSLLTSLQGTPETVRELVDRARLAEATSKSTEEEAITLSTIHKSKGLEWPVVFIVHCSDGSMPHIMSQTPEELEEELNMFYVAQTRAKNLLYMLHTHMRSDFTGNHTLVRSPYVLENIPKLEEMKAKGTAIIHKEKSSPMTSLNEL